VTKALVVSALRGGGQTKRASGQRPIRTTLATRVALALLALATLCLQPATAQAERASSHARAFLSGRIDAGSVHSCAIRPDGDVYCWGQGAFGQLGYGNTEDIGDDESPSVAGPVDLGGHGAVAVSTAAVHSCAVLDNGTVRCWGNSEYGELGYGNRQRIGDNETPGSVGPVDLGSGRSAVSITTGYTHTCALLDNGSVRCWGNGMEGELGYGNTQGVGAINTPGSAGPVNMGAGRSAVAITAGAYHTCAILDNGNVSCWGRNESGQLGYGTVFNNVGDNETPGSMGPVNVGAGRTAVAIAAGEEHTCALLDNGTVRCWGANNTGQLGYGSSPPIGDDETPAAAGPVNLGGHSAVAITAGPYHTCATLDDGTVRCWGGGEYGRLGYGNEADIKTPTSVPVDLGTGRNAVAISAGYWHTCALLDNGATRCWGIGNSGQLGYGNEEWIGDDDTPGTAGPIDFGEAHGALSVVTGASHSCALLEDGSVNCWGNGANGRLGYGNTANIGDNETPGSVGRVNLGAGRTALSITAGESHTCALLDNGTVRCWGNGANGRLGYANTLDVGDNETPGSVGPVNLGTGRTAIGIAAGGAHTCALLDNGTVRCWGLASSGQVGYANTTTIGDNETPGSVGPVDLGGRSAVEIVAGADHSCALLDNGTMRCWGFGGTGQLGYASTATIGDNETPASPAAIDLGTGRTGVTVAAGGDHTCARLETGIVRCWGLASSGQLGYMNTTTIGDNETPGTAGPVDVGFGRTATSVTTGESHTCARLENGTVRCWGLGADGRLGYASTTTIGDNESPGFIGPVNLGFGRTALKVSAGGSHTCAVLDDGTVRCWGLNSSGQLGYGNTTTIGDNETPATAGPVDLNDDPPTAVNDAATVSEDVPTAIDVLANDTDIDGGSKSIASKTNGAHGTVVITGGGTGLTFTPAANYCGPDSFTYELTPGGSQATVSVTVACVDDPPVAVNDSATVAEDSSASIVDVLPNDTDIDGGPKSVASKTNGAHGSVAIFGGGAGVTYTPNPDYCGPDSFTYSLAPGGSTATVAVTVSCLDDPPVAVNDSAAIPEDAPATAINVLANDTDVEGDSKTITAKTEGAHGSVAITGGGTGLTYTPAANYCGPDTFTYTINGGSQATVAITVTCVDDPPAAVNDSSTVAEDSSATAIDVLANETDIDGGPKKVESKTNGAHGTVAITGGGSGLSYTPEANYCGPDSFSYTLNGGSQATVSINVTCSDDPPVAVNDSATVAEGSSPTIVDVLSNDTDIDGGPKSIASKTNGANGNVVITGGGVAVTYQPNANYCGPDSFTYTLNGGSTATVSITVSCSDDPPVAVADSTTIAEDSSATAIDALANDTDVDGGAKSIVSKTNGSHGTVAITGGGSGLTYTPDANYCGADSFSYTLNGGSQATVSITVSCVDDPPAAVNDSSGLQEDSSATAIDVLVNDTDIDGGPKKVESKTNGAHGTVAITGGGSGLTYTPAANYCGADSFTYTLNGGSQATVSINVTCSDDPPVAVNDADTVIEDAPATAIDVLANDTDLDGGAKAVMGRTNGAHGVVAILGAGAGVTYTPSPNYCGADSFTYTLNGGSMATVSIDVTCVDEPAPPTGGGGGSGGTGSTTIVQPPAAGSSAPVVNITPGIGVVSGRRHPRVAVKGVYAFFTLTCKLADRDCKGIVTISANVPSITLGPTMRNVTVVKGKFRVGSGRSVLVRARLTRRGLEILKKKRSLRGVAARMAIVDAGNGERGRIEVNLVRRPKASLLPSPRKRP
jgi:alpha-tubulin suppressor-like RCC1 family protein